ncbi:hypothetical protein ACFYYN_36215 [Streptomyces sp. NPDC001902]
MENGIDRLVDGWDVRAIRGVGVSEVTVGGTVRLHIGSNGIEVHSPAELTAGTETYPVHASARINLDRVVARLALRAVDEVLAVTPPALVASVAFNGHVQAKDRAASRVAEGTDRGVGLAGGRGCPGGEWTGFQCRA